MIQRSLILGQLIANAHPVDVRLLFQRFGITAPPTGKTILEASLVYGSPFIAELYEIANKSSFSRADGLETQKLLDNAADKIAALPTAKTSGWDKFFSIFNKAGSVLSTGTTAWESLSAIFNGGQPVDTGDAALTNEMYKLQLEAQKEAAASQTKTYLLIGAALLVLVLGFMMYNKNK